MAGLPLEIRVHSSARRLRLRFDPRKHQLTLTVPPRVSRRRALAWAAEHEGWARAAVEAAPRPVALGPGGALPLYGRPHPIDWAPERPRRVVREGDRIVAGGPLEGLEARILRWSQAEARAVLTAETGEFARAAGVAVARVSVGDPTSRWGSCSTSGAIRYSWRLIMTPDFVRRATVAHEVAHRLHMDHSPRFHAALRHLLGEDPRPAREWLRAHGAALHLVGSR